MLYTELPVYKDTYQLVLKVFELSKLLVASNYTWLQKKSALKINYCLVGRQRVDSRFKINLIGVNIVFFGLLWMQGVLGQISPIHTLVRFL